jgi:hypothetical protein
MTMCIEAQLKYIAAQEAYARRPFAVRWEDSIVAATNRFETFNEAFDYVQQQWANIRKEVSTATDTESKLRRSYLETPEGRVSLRYVLLCDDVRSN